MGYKLSDAIAVARQEVYDEYASKGSNLKFGNGNGAVWLEISSAEYKARLFFAACKGNIQYEYTHILLQLVYPKSLGSKDTPQAKWNDYLWLIPFNYTKDKYFSLEDRCVESHGGIDNSIPESEFEGSKKRTIELAKKMLEFYFNLVRIKTRQS